MSVAFGVPRICSDRLFGTWHSWGRTLALGVGEAAIFGLLMAASLVSSARRAMKGGKPGRIRQVRTVEVRGGREEGIRKAADALSRLRGSSAPTIDAASGTVVKRTGMSWKSWGEIVTARVEP